MLGPLTFTSNAADLWQRGEYWPPLQAWQILQVLTLTCDSQAREHAGITSRPAQQRNEPELPQGTEALHKGLLLVVSGVTSLCMCQAI